MLGQSLVYVPSFNSAKSCGARILSVIQRTPKVKTEDGLRDKKDWVINISKIRLFILAYFIIYFKYNSRLGDLQLKYYKSPSRCNYIII